MVWQALTSTGEMGKGLVTASSTAIAGLARRRDQLTNDYMIVGNGSNVGDGVSGDATIATGGALTLATLSPAVPAGSYGSATSVGNSPVNGKGLVTAASSTAIAGLAPGAISLTNDYMIVGNGSNVGAAVQMSGDATIATGGALTVDAERGHTFKNAAPTNAQLLIWNSTNTDWEPESMGTDATITNAGAVTVAQATNNFTVLGGTATLGNGSNTGSLVVEDASHTFTTTFVGGNQSTGGGGSNVSLSYTLPIVAPTAGQVLSKCGGNSSTLSWVTGGGAVNTDGTTMLGDGSAGNKIRINLGNANTWTALQTFNGGVRCCRNNEYQCNRFFRYKHRHVINRGKSENRSRNWKCRHTAS